MLGLTANCIEGSQPMLYDHRPLPLSEDDYLRVCQIPRQKVALMNSEFMFHLKNLEIVIRYSK